MYRFAYVEPSLHPWDEATLIMVDDLSDVLLESISIILLRIFALILLRNLAYSSPFLEVSLSGLGMRVILAS
jgi:hypothetical protein